MSPKSANCDYGHIEEADGTFTEHFFRKEPYAGDQVICFENLVVHCWKKAKEILMIYTAIILFLRCDSFGLTQNIGGFFSRIFGG